MGISMPIVLTANSLCRGQEKGRMLKLAAKIGISG
jgi:hypothetical protein